MNRVEHLIAEYMRQYSVGYIEAIKIMITDLESAKDNAMLKEDAEYDASNS